MHTPAPRLGKQAHQVRHQVIIANERRNRVDLAITQILDSHRLHGHAAVDGTCQQAAMEGAQAATAGSGAFGEDQQRPGQPQLPGDLFAQALAVSPPRRMNSVPAFSASQPATGQ